MRGSLSYVACSDVGDGILLVGVYASSLVLCDAHDEARCDNDLSEPVKPPHALCTTTLQEMELRADETAMRRIHCVKHGEGSSRRCDTSVEVYVGLVNQ